MIDRWVDEVPDSATRPTFAFSRLQLLCSADSIFTGKGEGRVRSEKIHLLAQNTGCLGDKYAFTKKNKKNIKNLKPLTSREAKRRKEFLKTNHCKMPVQMEPLLRGCWQASRHYLTKGHFSSAMVADKGDEAFLTAEGQGLQVAL